MNIGAGRIIYQDLTRITKAIEDGDFFENKVLLQAVENVKKNGSDLHLFGLAFRWWRAQPQHTSVCLVRAC